MLGKEMLLKNGGDGEKEVLLSYSAIIGRGYLILLDENKKEIFREDYVMDIEAQVPLRLKLPMKVTVVSDRLSSVSATPASSVVYIDGENYLLKCDIEELHIYLD